MKTNPRKKNDSEQSGPAGKSGATGRALNTPMTRGKFLRTAGAGAAGLAAAGMFGSGTAKAQGAPRIVPQEDGTVWVYPVGRGSQQAPGFPHPLFAFDIYEDAYNVQMAILGNPGKTILLKATNLDGDYEEFFFGIPNHEGPYEGGSGWALVSFQRSGGELRGETVTIDGAKKTSTVVGGSQSFCAKTSIGTAGVSPRVPEAFATSAPISVAFRNFDFRSVWGEGITAFGGDTFDESGNPVGYDETGNPLERPLYSDVIVENVRFEDFMTPDGYLSRPVYLGNVGSQTVKDCFFENKAAGFFSMPQGICFGSNGSTLIENNLISLGPAVFGSIGIFPVWGSPDADVMIRKNAIGNANIGMVCEFNQGSFSIIDNDITAWNVGIGGGNFGPFGLVRGNNVNMVPDSEPLSEFNQIPWMDEGNAMNFRDLCPLTFGVLGVDLGGPSELFGLPFHLQMSGGVFVGNTFRGKMNMVAYLGDWTYSMFTGYFPLQSTADGNVFQGNDISGATLVPGTINGQSFAKITYWFGENTSDNAVKGKTGGTSSVVRGNDSNVFTGPGFSGVGINPASIAQALAGKKNAWGKIPPEMKAGMMKAAKRDLSGFGKNKRKKT